MNAVATPPRVTPEDLLQMPGFELVNGQLRERRMSYLSSHVAGRITSILDQYTFPRGLGWVSPADTSFQCFADDPKRVRRVDVAFIKLARFSIGDAMTEGHCRLVPDLVVEVVSPNDLAYQVDEKIEEWLVAGVKVVWEVNPKLKRVAVRAHGREVKEYQGDDVISEESLFPGFGCPVAEFFQMPVESPAIDESTSR